MNAWARHYADVLTADLDEGETLLGANRVVVVSASRVEVPDRSAAPEADRPAVPRIGFRRPAILTARANGFALPAKIFVLGVSDRRVLVWRSTPMLARPQALFASYPIHQIASIRRRRRIGATRVSIVLDSGALIVVQALWSRHLGDLATAFTSVRS
jgi:hypothetical protein